MLVNDVRYAHYESGELSERLAPTTSPHLLGVSPGFDGEGVLSRQPPQQGDHAALTVRRRSFHPSAPRSPDHVERPTSHLDDALNTEAQWRRRLAAAPHPYSQSETNRQNYRDRRALRLGSIHLLGGDRAAHPTELVAHR
jgi:hypothetical protein